MIQKIDYDQPQVIGSFLEPIRAQGRSHFAGPVALPVNVDGGLGYYLKDLLGAETYTTPGAGVGSHVMVPQAAVGLTGLSLELNRDANVSATNVWGLSGAHCTGLDFVFEPGKIIKATAQVSGRNMVVGKTAQADTYGTNVRYLVGNVGTASFSGAGSPTASIRSGSLKIERRHNVDRYALGSSNPLEATPGVYGISGQFVLYFSEMNAVTAFTGNNLTTTLTLSFTADTVSAQVLGLTFALTNIGYNGETPHMPNPQEFYLTIPYTSWGSTAGNVLTATLVNTKTSAY